MAMHSRTAGLVAFAAGLALASAAQADVRSFQFDVNELPYQAKDAQGNDSAFGGLTHTGSLVYSDLPGTSFIAGIFIKDPPNPYQKQNNFTGTLTDCSMTISLVNGQVTGGSMSLQIDGGADSYSVEFVPNTGKVDTFVGGGFKIEFLTRKGTFSDADFGGVPIADFFGAQGGDFLTGSMLAFKINPGESGGGFGDFDHFTTAPSPGTAACLALAGLFAGRRRRS